MTGVARINLKQRHTRSRSFVGNHLLELIEAPRVMQAALRTAKSLVCSVTDSCQILKGYCRFRLPCFLYDVFADRVIDVFDRSRFFARQPFQDSSAVLAGRRLAFGSPRLQRLANLVSLKPIGIESFTAKNFSGGSGGDVLYTQVNTKRSSGVLRFRGIFLNLNVEKVFTLFLAELRRCWLLVVKSVTLVFTDCKLEFDSAMQQSQTRNPTFERKDSSIIINRSGTENRFLFGFQLRCNTSNSTHSKVGRESKLQANDLVATVMQLELIADIVLLSPLTDIVARIGECFQRFLDVRSLRFAGFKFARYGSYRNHALNIGKTFTKVKDGIPPPAKAGGFLP